MLRRGRHREIRDQEGGGLVARNGHGIILCGGEVGGVHFRRAFRKYHRAVGLFHRVTMGQDLLALGFAAWDDAIDGVF